MQMTLWSPKVKAVTVQRDLRGKPKVKAVTVQRDLRKPKVKANAQHSIGQRLKDWESFSKERQEITSEKLERKLKR